MDALPLPPASAYALEHPAHTHPVIQGKWCGPQGSFISKIVPDEWIGICNVGTNNAKFYNACKTHDGCYDTWGAPRAQCDRALRQDLEEECDRAFHTWVCQTTRGTCRLAALGYYEAVVAWGEDAYREAQDRARRPLWSQSESGAVDVVNGQPIGRVP